MFCADVSPVFPRRPHHYSFAIVMFGEILVSASELINLSMRALLRIEVAEKREVSHAFCFVVNCFFHICKLILKVVNYNIVLPFIIGVDPFLRVRSAVFSDPTKRGRNPPPAIFITHKISDRLFAMFKRAFAPFF